ncbi:MAG: hypothetical protein K1X57_06770 [Gemmataceae bacterium]|nr:hypothetical protein [Gemmataceae bacterium]
MASATETLDRAALTAKEIEQAFQECVVARPTRVPEFVTRVLGCLATSRYSARGSLADGGGAIRLELSNGTTADLVDARAGSLLRSICANLAVRAADNDSTRADVFAGRGIVSHRPPTACWQFNSQNTTDEQWFVLDLQDSP